MKIAIIVLNWNGVCDTVNCLSSINKLSKNQFTVKTIVVDNASADDSVNRIRSVFPHIDIIKNKCNLGFAGGNNVGIRQALKYRADFIFIVNNDTILENKILLEIFQTQQKYSASIISPKIYFSPGSEFHKNRYSKSELGKVIWYAGGKIDWNNIIGFHIGVDEVDRGQFNKVREVDYATGAAMFIKKDVFEKIGLLDEKYFLYYEDLDFCMRAKKSNMQIMFSPKAVIWHNNAGSSGSGSALQDYYITRNRLLFGLRFAPLKSKLALLKETMKIGFWGRDWQKKGVSDYFLGKFGKGSYLNE